MIIGLSVQRVDSVLKPHTQTLSEAGSLLPTALCRADWKGQ